MLVICLSIFCLSVCWYYLRCKYCNYKLRVVGNVPIFPKYLPGFGHCILLAKDLFSVMKDLGKYAVNNNGITALLFGPFPLYVIADPVDATVILNTCLKKMFVYKLINPLFGDLLVSATVPTWKRNRQIVDLAFKQNILEGYMKVFNTQALTLLELIDAKADKGFVDVTNEIIKNVLETTCRLPGRSDGRLGKETKRKLLFDLKNFKRKTTMGMQSNDQLYVNEKYVKALHRVFEITTLRVQKPWMVFDAIFKFCKAKRDLDENLLVIHEISAKMVRLRKSEYLERKKIDNEITFEELGTNTHKVMPDSPNGNFISYLDIMIQNSVSEEGSTFTDLQLRYICGNILLAAFYTTTYELLFTLVCIGSYEEVQRKIFHEITEVLGDEERVTKEHVKKLIYLEAVIKEAIRLYPIGPMVGREASTDVQLDKVTIPAGSSIVVHLWAINRHKKYWGEDAEEFNPDRWLNANTLPEHPNAFGSFSFGRRNCVGKQYAMMYMKTTLVPLLRKYRICSEHKKMQFDLYIMLKATSGHLMKFELR